MIFVFLTNHFEILARNVLKFFLTLVTLIQRTTKCKHVNLVLRDNTYILHFSLHFAQHIELTKTLIDIVRQFISLSTICIRNSTLMYRPLADTYASNDPWTYSLRDVLHNYLIKPAKQLFIDKYNNLTLPKRPFKLIALLRPILVRNLLITWYYNYESTAIRGERTFTRIYSLNIT